MWCHTNQARSWACLFRTQQCVKASVPTSEPVSSEPDPDPDPDPSVSPSESVCVQKKTTRTNKYRGPCQGQEGCVWNAHGRQRHRRGDPRWCDSHTKRIPPQHTQCLWRSHLLFHCHDKQPQPCTDIAATRRRRLQRHTASAPHSPGGLCCGSAALERRIMGWQHAYVPPPLCFHHHPKRAASPQRLHQQCSRPTRPVAVASSRLRQATALCNPCAWAWRSCGSRP